MTFKSVKAISLTSWIIFFSACSLTGIGPHQSPSSSPASTRIWPVNSYYLFSEAHLSRKQGNLKRSVDLMQQAVAIDPESIYLKRELAGLWLLQKETTTALKLLEEILAHHPDDVETLMLAGQIYRNTGEAEKAIDAFTHILEQDPKRQNIYLLLGDLYMDQERWDEARATYQQLVDHFPRAYAGYFFLGRISTIDGDGDKARAYFEKTLSIEPDLVESRFELGAIHESNDDFAKAAAEYEAILDQSPNNTQAVMALGYAYTRLGNETGARQLLVPLGEKSTTDQAIVRTLVRHYIDADKYEAAAVIIQEMMAAPRPNPDLYYLSGIALDGQGQKQAAIDSFRNVAPQSRFYQNATIHAALLYQETDQLQAAIAFLTESIEKMPQNPEFRLYLGSFYEQMEAYEKAQTVLQEGLELQPQHARILFRLGVVYDKWGKKDESIAAMKQVIQIDPEDANALNYLGYTYADMGINLDEAEQLIRRALEHKPGDGYITDSLAWVYYQRGQYEKALPLLEEAARLVPDDPIVREHLGDVYRQLGMIDKAIQSYRQSIENGHTDKASVEEKIRLLNP
jgi:tetratricopeptide (TPR) repeat protein